MDIQSKFFNKNGISFKGNLMCKSLGKCGKDSIKILDGSGKTKKDSYFYSKENNYSVDYVSGKAAQ